MSDEKKDLTTVSQPHELVNLTLNELKKMIQDVREGKQPKMPSSIERIAFELEKTNKQKTNMSDEEIKAWADNLASEVSKLNNK